MISKFSLSDFYNRVCYCFAFDLKRKHSNLSKWKKFFGVFEFFSACIRLIQSKYFRFNSLLIELEQGLKLIDYEWAGTWIHPEYPLIDDSFFEFSSKEIRNILRSWFTKSSSTGTSLGKNPRGFSAGRFERTR